MRQLDQNRRDHQRKTYRLHFPAELDADSVTSWIRSISGTLRSSRNRLVGVPTVAFEVWATAEGISHRLAVPWQNADFVIAQLRTLVPGIRVTPEEEPARRVWTRAVEVGLTHSSRQLRIYSASTTSASLLASLQALGPTETILMQWVVTPSVPAAPPSSGASRSWWGGPVASTPNADELKERRAKLDEPNVLAVLRIGTVADTNAKAEHLLHRVRSALASTHSAAVRFQKRLATKKELQHRIDEASASTVFPIQLAAPELTALIAWPIGNPFVSGLPATLARQLPATEQVPKEGRVLGRSNFPGNERQIAVGFEDARKHVHVVGPTGVGKTVLLANMLKQDMDQGYGVVLIENKGDLYRAALDYIPPHRRADVILLDVTDASRPVGFNVLNQGDPRVVVDELCALFDHLYRDARGVWTREVLYHGLHTLITKPGMTFVDLATLLMPGTKEEVAWADEMRRAGDPELRQFWQRFENQPKPAQDRFVQPVMDRIWQLTARAELRNVIGQSQSSFQMTDVVARNRILLVNLQNLARETASLTGTLLMNALWHAVKTTPSDRPTFLYLDEFQDFMSLPIEPEDMLAKARSFGLGMTLAHQHLDQLPTDVRTAVLSNARTKVVFQTSATDARTMTREFGGSVTDQDFMSLGQYEAIARIATASGVSSPVTLTTSAPARGYGDSNAIVQTSRATYGRAVEDVRTEIQERHKSDAPDRPRPSIGSDWS